jgi:hypothetical protein
MRMVLKKPGYKAASVVNCGMFMAKPPGCGVFRLRPSGVSAALCFLSFWSAAIPASGCSFHDVKFHGAAKV